MKSSKQIQDSVELKNFHSPVEARNSTASAKRKSSADISTKSPTNQPIEPNLSPHDEPKEFPSIKHHHKMSVPTVSPPSTAATHRSRLASFNLPLFNTGPKNIFSAHKRRGSLGKALQKNVRPSLASETVAIDMDEDSKLEKSESILDGGRKLMSLQSIARELTLDDLGSSVGAASLVSPLDRAQGSTKKRGRQMSESSAARVSLTDEKQSKLSLEDNARIDSARAQEKSDHRKEDDAADLQRTERGLLSLLDDFNNGRLKAFGSSEASVALRGVREMQERLARSHFDMYTLQEKIGFDNPKMVQLSLNNWQSLMGGMQELTDAVHRLGNSSKISQVDTHNGDTNHEKIDLGSAV